MGEDKFGSGVNLSLRKQGMAKIAVVGSLVFDLVAKAERRPQKGESLLGEDFGMFPGGKGANQAVQAARLGSEVHLIGRVGNDYFGQCLIDSLKSAGVNTDFVLRDEETTTAVGCIVIDKDGDNSIVMVPQANMRVKREDVDKAKEYILGADVLLMQLEIPLSVVQYTAELAREKNIFTILNPAPAKRLSEDILKLPNLLTPNEVEAEILTGEVITDLSSAEKAGRRLLAQGGKNVIITLGEKGSLLVSKEETVHFPGYKISTVDTTAAGDAFNGALAVAIAEGFEIKAAIKFANAAGALSATKMGAQPSLPMREEVEEFLKTCPEIVVRENLKPI